jgi:hypothetical protein
MTDAWLGNRYFRNLTDAELVSWRPSFYFSAARNANVGAANREILRRAKVAGFQSATEWMRSVHD